MDKIHTIQHGIVSDANLATKKKVASFRAELTNAYGVDIYYADDLTVCLLHDLALINSGKSPKVYI